MLVSSVPWYCWLGVRKGSQPAKDHFSYPKEIGISAGTQPNPWKISNCQTLQTAAAAALPVVLLRDVCRWGQVTKALPMTNSRVLLVQKFLQARIAGSSSFYPANNVSEHLNKQHLSPTDYILSKLYWNLLGFRLRLRLGMGLKVSINNNVIYCNSYHLQLQPFVMAGKK